jgi:sugar/nucleoside kinase (ribokinase family)
LEHWRASLERSAFRHLHLGSMNCLQTLLPLVELARERGATISSDCQDGPHLEKVCVCWNTLPIVDIFMPNAREACIMTGTERAYDAARRLGEKIRVVVVKDGANGAWVAHGGEVMHVPGIQAGDVVDTTGAGDCFNAGFLYGYVTEGAPLDVCARYGNICGGLSVTGVGGATTAPTHTQLMDWMNRQPV